MGAVLLTLLSVPLFAHDMWIEPSTFSPKPGQIVGVRLRVGQDLLGDPLPRDPALVNQFIVEDAEGRKPVVGRDGADPAGMVRAAAPGLLVIGYRSNPSSVEQPPEKFNRYLKEEGLDHIARSNVKVRELFSRCAKSLLLSGSASPTQRDRRLGFTLELVAERNPYAGEELPVRLMYENRPLTGALVVAMNRLNPAAKLSARTDSHGRVRFRLRQPGIWLIKSVHMIPAPAGTNAEWISFWASLTFERSGREGLRENSEGFGGRAARFLTVAARIDSWALLDSGRERQFVVLVASNRPITNLVLDFKANPSRDRQEAGGPATKITGKAY